MAGGGENREVSLKGLIAVAIWIACGYTMVSENNPTFFIILNPRFLFSL
jgi:hypothetical protein